MLSAALALLCLPAMSTARPEFAADTGLSCLSCHENGADAGPLTEISREVMDAAGIGPEDIDLFIPHQANMRIIQAVGSRLKLTNEQVFTNVQRVGNTSAASIPLAMVDARDEGRLRPGSLLLTSAFGGGLTWASSLIRF